MPDIVDAANLYNTKILSRNYSCCDLGVGGRNNREAQLDGFFVQHGNLLLAVFLFVELLTAVNVFLSKAQHAVEQALQKLLML